MSRPAGDRTRPCRGVARGRAERRALPLSLLSVVGPALLAGVLHPPAGVWERWCWSGAFIYPVGDPHQVSARAWHGIPPFRIMRGFYEPDPSRRRPRNRDPHEGVDLSNGRGGDIVCAAAHGLVVLAEQRDSVAAFGSRVVIAHRMPDGGLAYSVYAHLRPGSIRVGVGDLVWLGQPIGRVGRSGNATGNHLHFEVRRPTEPGERWENTAAVDPLAFLAAWLPGHRADTSRVGRYLEWAEQAALIGPRDEGSEPLTRAAWQEILARAARHPVRRPPQRPDSLRLALIECSVLPVASDARLDSLVRWKEVSRDIGRLRTLGVRLPPPPLAAGVHRSECARVFGASRPLERLKVIAGATTPVDRAAACLLLADLAAPAERPVALAGKPAPDSVVTASRTASRVASPARGSSRATTTGGSRAATSSSRTRSSPTPRATADSGSVAKH